MRLLEEVLRRRTPLEEATVSLRRRNAKGPEPALTDADWGLARAISTTALRRLGTIRSALGARLRLGVPERSGRLETILVVAAAQLLFMDTPDHAVVDTAVSLIREEKQAERYAGLANALLRRVARERDAILASATTDLPDWLAERWRARYGADVAAAMMAAVRRQPTLDVTVASDAAGWAERLGGAPLFANTVRVLSQAPVPELSGYAEGAWWVQDAAASIPALLLDAKRGEHVLDLCAAPGGKTAQLAATGASVVAVDRAQPRMDRLRENLARLRMEVETHVGDALAFGGSERYDAVLLDAPCTATGTLRRHPDVAWTKTEADIGKLAGLQSRLLAHAAGLVKPGGRIVYATCSLEPEEGETQIAAFVDLHPEFVIERAEPWLPVALAETAQPDGAVRILPHFLPNDDARRAGLDGFFAARLVRRR